MASRLSAPHWEAPKFSFNAPNQVDAWKSFYTRALDFLEALDIDPNVEDQGKRDWRQIKMMFEDEDHLALQTLIDNQTITPGDPFPCAKGHPIGHKGGCPLLAAQT